MAKFYSVVTNKGHEKIADAISNGSQVNIAYIAVGDGNGNTVVPEPEQEQLINERHRVTVNQVFVDKTNPSMVIVEGIFDEAVGGFWIREMGVYSSDGILVAVASMADTYKPQTSEGTATNQFLRMALIVSSPGIIELTVDPAIITATKEYVDDMVADAMEKASNALQEAQQKTTFNEIYPVGLCVWFGINKNPNKIWLNSKWIFTGENKAIRIGNSNGSDVGISGGSDSITINVDNLPKHKFSVTGQTADYDYGTKETSVAPPHKHKGGMVGPGESWDDNYIVGSDNDSGRTRNYTSEENEHGHDVVIGKHKHTLTGETNELGGGKEISIINRHIKLMLWCRVE